MSNDEQSHKNQHSVDHKLVISENPARDPWAKSGKPGWPKGLGIAILCLCLAFAVFWMIRKHYAAADKAATASARAGTPPIPVVAGKVVRKNVPIYLDGLGTVQAFNTVTVHVRVDGQLKKVAFVEGQDVHQGDLLAQIDPDPYQAQLAQAIAKKAQDEAQLANARLDLKREADLFAAKIDSQQAFDTQQALVNQLQAAVKADDAAIESAQVQVSYTT